MKRAEFISMVADDISRCNQVLDTKSNSMELLNELVGKYSKVSANFPDIQMNHLLFKMNPNQTFEYIQTIKGFLMAYHLNDCEDYRFDESKSEGINVIANISNSIQNNVEVINFAEVRGKVESMTSLRDSDIEEILEKVSELEKIVYSSDRKTKKWENAKGIIKWVADKGVDVGITLLPLIMKIGQN